MAAPPPISPDDAATLNRYLRHPDLHALAADCFPTPDNLPDLPAAIAFLTRPDIAAWIDLSRSFRADALRHAALNTLARILRESPDPLQLRLAATTILYAVRSPDGAPQAPRPRHAATPAHPTPPPDDQRQHVEPQATRPRATAPRATAPMGHIPPTDPGEHTPSRSVDEFFALLAQDRAALHDASEHRAQHDPAWDDPDEIDEHAFDAHIVDEPEIDQSEFDLAVPTPRDAVRDGLPPTGPNSEPAEPARHAHAAADTS